MNKLHTPLMTISKNANPSKKRSIIVRVVAFVLAIFVCSIVSSLITGKGVFEFIVQLFSGNFGTERRIWRMLFQMSMLLLIALAITPAFKMKFWNIGAEGQVLVSGLACCMIMVGFGSKLPYFVLILLMLVCSILAGVVWTVIPAIFKAFWNTNETLFTLMMNYIAMCLVSFYISLVAKDGSGIIPAIKDGNLPSLFGKNYLIIILIVAVVTVLMALYLKKSKQGYEISVVGESVNTARYIGINVKKVMIRTMVINGALCGIAGFLLISGYSHTIAKDTVGGMGFTAILVSWLGHFEPTFMVITSFLVSFISNGASQMGDLSGVGKYFPSIMIGIFFFFIIGCEFFINYNLHFHKEKFGFLKKEEEE